MRNTRGKQRHLTAANAVDRGRPVERAQIEGRAIDGKAIAVRVSGGASAAPLGSKAVRSRGLKANAVRGRARGGGHVANAVNHRPLCRS